MLHFFTTSMYSRGLLASIVIRTHWLPTSTANTLVISRTNNFFFRFLEQRTFFFNLSGYYLVLKLQTVHLPKTQNAFARASDEETTKHRHNLTKVGFSALAHISIQSECRLKTRQC